MHSWERRKNSVVTTSTPNLESELPCVRDGKIFKGEKPGEHNAPRLQLLPTQHHAERSWLFVCIWPCRCPTSCPRVRTSRSLTVRNLSIYALGRHSNRIAKANHLRSLYPLPIYINSSFGECIITYAQLFLDVAEFVADRMGARRRY